MVIVHYHLPGDLIFQFRKSSPGNFVQHQHPFQPRHYDLGSASSHVQTSMNFIKNGHNPEYSTFNNPQNQTWIRFVSRIGTSSTDAYDKNKFQDAPLMHCSSLKNVILNSPTEKSKTWDHRPESANIRNSESPDNKNLSDMKPEYVTNVQSHSIISNSMLNTCPNVILSSHSQHCDNESKRFDGEWGTRIKIPKNSANVIRLHVNFLNESPNERFNTNNSSLFKIPKTNISNFLSLNEVNNDIDYQLAGCLNSENNQHTFSKTSELPNDMQNYLPEFESYDERDSSIPVLQKPDDVDYLSDLDKLSPTNDEVLYDLYDKNCLNELSFSLHNVKPESTKPCTKKSKNTMAKHKCQKISNSSGVLLNEKFPFITKDNIFNVNLTKTSRGLGLSICGGWDDDPTNLDACLIRIKRLYPLHPAYTCGKLKIGDIILSVNGCNLTGLSYAEAIEVLRMAPPEVMLTICRPEEGILPPIPENSRLIISSMFDSNSNQSEFCRPFANVQYMEFDVTLTKIAGSLGFTIGKDDDEENPAHYIKDLVKEPALSCGTIQSGDKIILVNGVDISDMSHSEAIAFFRSLPDEVTLCLWRQVLPVSSPLSPLSPTVPFFNDEEKKNKPKPLLRKEALDMLSDKARLRKDKKINSSPKSHKGDNEQNLDFQEISNKGDNIIDSSLTLSQLSIKDKCISSSSSGITSTIDSPSENSDLYCEPDSSGCGFDILDQKMNESDSLHTNSSRSPSFDKNFEEKYLQSKPQRPSFLDLSSDNLSPRKQKYGRSFVPASPQENNSDSLDSDFKILDSNDSFSTTDNAKNTSSEISPLPFTSQDSSLMKWRGMTLNEDEKADLYTEIQMKPSHITVELDRRWNSRLGFSLVTVDTTDIQDGIYIKVIYPGSLAAIDGRLQPGDRLIEVNDNQVTGLGVQQVIDLLRKSQGKVTIIVERLPDNFHGQLSNSSENNVLSRSQSENESIICNEITAMNVKNNNINRCYRWETSSTSPLDNGNFNGFVNLKV